MKKEKGKKKRLLLKLSNDSINMTQIPGILTVLWIYIMQHTHKIRFVSHTSPYITSTNKLLLRYSYSIIMWIYIYMHYSWPNTHQSLLLRLNYGNIFRQKHKQHLMLHYTMKNEGYRSCP